MAKQITRAQRSMFAADVTATDVAKCESYFRRRFRSWNDAEEMIGEALAHWWTEYCTARAKLSTSKLTRSAQHEQAAKLACNRAAGRVASCARFARAVATQYVDLCNPADSLRRKAIDDQRALDAADDAALRSLAGNNRKLDPWERCRIETCVALGIIGAPPARPMRCEDLPVEPNPDRCGAPSPRVRPQRIAYQPVAMEPQAPIAPTAPGRTYSAVRLARQDWNTDRLEARVDAGEWCYVAALEYAYSKAE